MKQRRSLITLVAVFFVALACAFGVLNFKSKASAAEYITAPTTFTVAEEGFELAEKASIRLTDGKAAIKFTAIVTEDFHNAHEGANYIATMNIVGSDDVKALAFDAPEFNDGVAELNAYLNFAGASEEILELALATEFEAAVYAEVDGTYYQAKGSNTVDRSMRVVANDAYLNYEEGKGYEKADVADLGYFTNGLRSDKEFAVVDTENTLYVRIPGAPAAATEIYVDDVKVAATYDATTAKYVVEDFTTEGNYVTVFAADGKAYSSNVVTGAIAINDLDGLKATIGVEGNLNGYYVITNDIEVGTWTYVDNKLWGTINALDYRLTNYIGSSTDSHYALVHESYGGTIRNLVMSSSVAGITNNGGMIIGFVMPDVKAVVDEETGTVITPAVTYEDTVVDNVVCFNQYNNHNTAAINVVSNGVVVKDSIFIMAKNANMTNPGGALAYNNSAADGIIEAENTIVVTSPFSPVALNANKVHGVDVFKTVGALYNADKAGEYEVTDAQWAKLTSIKAFMPLNAENITDLRSATDGYYVITEDIDMKPITIEENYQTLWYEVDRDFQGVLDGADYVLYNVFLDCDNAGMFGGFLSMGYYNPLVTNFNAVAHYTGERGGFFGRARSFTINESVIVVGGAMAYGSAGLCGVIDGSVSMKDSFYYHGGAGSSNQGWFASTEGLAGRPGFDNVYVVNASTNHAPITGYTNETAIKTFDTCGKAAAEQVAAVANEDYFYFDDGADYLALTENTLPANVQAKVEQLAIVELCEETLDYAAIAPAGYWYLTDDLDVSDLISDRAIFNSFGMVYGSQGASASYRQYYGANIHLEGNGFAITGLKGVSAGNKASIIGEGCGNIIFRNITFKGTMAGSGSGSCFLVGIIREDNGQNKITLENVFIDLQTAGAYNGGIIVAWSPVGTTIYMDRVFINIATYNGPQLFVGHAWTGTINVNDVFVAGVPADVALSKESAVVFKDYSGNTVTPGGDGEYDFACTLTASLADLKAMNDGEDWAYAVDLFAALDSEFFVAE